MDAEDIKNLVVSALPGSEVTVVDTEGDGDHWSVTVASELFVGKSLLQQHKMVYSALGDRVGTALHSVQVNTRQA